MASVGVGAEAASALVDPRFWSGRRVLVTGHTGFKGAWLCLWLQSMNAEVTGLSNGVPTKPSLYELAGVASELREVHCDIRDYDAVVEAVEQYRPEVVMHLAAQPLVRPSFSDPRTTYETNVMGTVNVLDAVRRHPTARAVVNVTSDKCYENREWEWGYREYEPKGGHDPYSNSKGCAELVADAYRRSFFGSDDGPRLASARAGNVIGGGDWAADRLLPDVMGAALGGEAVRVRNPNSIRPWQHVLCPLSGYLILAQRLWESREYADGWNFGPADEDAHTVGWIVERIAERWPGQLDWVQDEGNHPHEARYLKLDSSRARLRLGWTPHWDLGDAVARTVDWYRVLRDRGDVRDITLAQISQYESA